MKESTPLNPEGFEERLRKVRLTGIVLSAAAAASLAVAMIVDPVPLLFLVLATVLGAAFGLTLSLSRKSMTGIGGGAVLAATTILFLNVRLTYFPELSDGLMDGLWVGISGWAVGILVVALPLARLSSGRKRPELRADIDTITRFRERGDSAFVAQLRLSAGKTPSGYFIALICMAAIMAGLGLYVWLFEDGLIGLLLAVMTALPIAFFAWMLKLKRSS
ncbi:MAG: hypothetical protein KFF77_11725 [Bacteroidetes bacterium]|nr:hypothetical protein [Bacteroidota bacterium]